MKYVLRARLISGYDAVPFWIMQGLLTYMLLFGKTSFLGYLGLSVLFLFLLFCLGKNCKCTMDVDAVERVVTIDNPFWLQYKRIIKFEDITTVEYLTPFQEMPTIVIKTKTKKNGFPFDLPGDEVREFAAKLEEGVMAARQSSEI